MLLMEFEDNRLVLVSRHVRDISSISKVIIKLEFKRPALL